MAYRLNPFTGTFDYTTSTSILDGRYVLKSGDTMTGDLSLLNSKIYIGNNSTYFILSGNDLSLYVNSTLRQMWTTTATTSAPGALAGQPIGMLLGLTYS